MSKIELSCKKDLKLTNVLIKEIQYGSSTNFQKEVLDMNNYIKGKGKQGIGPLIQYSNSYVDPNGVLVNDTKLMHQVNDHIVNIGESYKIEPILKVKNCMYVRYRGKEAELKFAYYKIQLEAFENDIALKGGSYTIILENQDGNIIADVFMERES